MRTNKTHALTESNSHGFCCQSKSGKVREKSEKVREFYIPTSVIGMLNSFFSQFEFRPLKFGLNSNFVYIFVEKLKQFAFDVCTVGRDEGHSTHATRREAVYQQCNHPGRQAMSHSIAVD